MSPVTLPRAPEALHPQSLSAPPGGARPSPATDPSAEATAGSVGPNPALRMDPELGLVVLEFRNRQGDVATTFPTSRELDAYRRAVRTGAAMPEGDDPRPAMNRTPAADATPPAPPPSAAAPRVPRGRGAA